MIAVGSDHGGYELKVEIISYLTSKGIECRDIGACDSKVSIDYPDVGLEVAEIVARGECEKAIIICGTGIGISIAANKVKNIRAALCTDSYMAKMARQHNDANVLALGGRVVGAGLALDIVDAFISTPFSNEKRHSNRISKITAMENKYFK